MGMAGLSSICMTICLVKNSDGVSWRVILNPRPMQMQQHLPAWMSSSMKGKSFFIGNSGVMK